MSLWSWWLWQRRRGDVGGGGVVVVVAVAMVLEEEAVVVGGGGGRTKQPETNSDAKLSDHTLWPRIIKALIVILKLCSFILYIQHGAKDNHSFCTISVAVQILISPKFTFSPTSKCRNWISSDTRFIAYALIAQCRNRSNLISPLRKPLPGGMQIGNEIHTIWQEPTHICRPTIKCHFHFETALGSLKVREFCT